MLPPTAGADDWDGSSELIGDRPSASVSVMDVIETGSDDDDEDEAADEEDSPALAESGLEAEVSIEDADEAKSPERLGAMSKFNGPREDGAGGLIGP